MSALKPGDARFYNLGIGKGYSVKEVIESAERVTGKKVPRRYGARRTGDPAILFANADKIRHDLDWSARYTEIDDIVATAWKWFENHPDGYGD